MLELSGEEHGDEDLVYGALDEDDGDSAEHRVRRIPAFEGPLEKGHEVLKCGDIKSRHQNFEKYDHSDHSEEMCN